jgi:assimilatory nitrate reductase catalytic subunit
MMVKATRTTCPYCGVGCGVVASVRADGVTEISGDIKHPANFGRLCSKGSALGETMSLDGRLLYPQINGQRVDWHAALELVAGRFKAAIAEHGPESVAFYVSGQILTEDYYAANKLMKGFIGTANIDTNSRLCMASSVAGHKRAFGSDTVPGTYEDLEQADLVVLVGSNLAWCHPVLYQRLADARETRGTKIVVIDPRRTATCDIADLHLAIASGADVALFAGLLAHLAERDCLDRAYIAQHTNGFDAALAAAAASTPDRVAVLTGLTPSDIASFYDLFQRTPRVVTVYSQGVNQSSAGTDKVNAIINCHLATGRIGTVGCGPFSVTGQPNAMGGRETGGLATTLAAHMDLDKSEHRRIVQTFWQSPTIAAKPGLKAVDMFRGVEDGRIKALWIMATNPVDSLPDANRARAALAKCPFVVVSDVVEHTDTTAHAHVLLPSAAWGEKDGTVTNSERRISRQRAFLPLPGEARPDWWQVAEIGRRMGFGAAFEWTHPRDIFAEYAALTATENAGTRDLDIGAHATISQAAYDRLAPFQWPQPAGKRAQVARFFGSGRYFTEDKRANFVPITWRPPASSVSQQYPLILNTGRMRDQWHTMTRTAKTARLMSHAPEPFVQIHPDDAARMGCSDGTLAVVASPQGRVVLRVKADADQRRGAVFVPLHWTDQYASSARIDAVIAAHTDPVSGQPEFKHTPVSVQPFTAAWYGFAVVRERPSAIPADYWAMAPVTGGWRVECAGLKSAEFGDLLQAVLAVSAADTPTDLISYEDNSVGERRTVAFKNDTLAGALYVSSEPTTVARTWVAEQLSAATIDSSMRTQLLAGRSLGADKDRGAIVCACFNVGCNEIVAAIRDGGCRTVADVGAALRAGTNCGSCRSEIAQIAAVECLQVAE